MEWATDLRPLRYPCTWKPRRREAFPEAKRFHDKQVCSYCGHVVASPGSSGARTYIARLSWLPPFLHRRGCAEHRLSYSNRIWAHLEAKTRHIHCISKLHAPESEPSTSQL
jgi:hypothetical protein